MSNLWDIAEYVESHPDNHMQRWRLAKKLYRAWEYRLALEHLFILRNEWDDKLNVRRYLAATYYRLSRFDESIRELEQAIEKWPEEIGLREQLAHVLFAAGRKLDAAEQWEKVVILVPEHRTARRAVKRIRDEELKDDEYSRWDAGEDYAADTGLEAIHCPNCGVENGGEFERCWQCHALLRGHSPRRAVGQPQAGTAKSRSRWVGAVALATVAFLTVDLYLTLNHFFPPDETDPLPATMSAFLSRELSLTRAVMGALMLVLWPLVFRLASIVVEEELTSEGRLYLAGAFSAALTYAVTWLPGIWFVLGPAIPVAASLLLCLKLFDVQALDGLRIWLVQGAITLLLIAAMLTAIHGPAILLESPAIFRYGWNNSSLKTAKVQGLLRSTYTIALDGTGSRWLDERMSDTEFHVAVKEPDNSMFVRLSEMGKTPFFFREIDAEEVEFVYRPEPPKSPYLEPSEEYVLDVHGYEEVPFQLMARSYRTIRLAPVPESLTE